jgi:hypothetical protein
VVIAFQDSEPFYRDTARVPSRSTRPWRPPLEFGAAFGHFEGRILLALMYWLPKLSIFGDDHDLNAAIALKIEHYR